MRYHFNKGEEEVFSFFPLPTNAFYKDEAEARKLEKV